MALSASTLKGEIKTVLESLTSTANNSQPDPQTVINNSINDLAEGIASAVVNHIKDNLEVKVQGTGYAGFTVISDSETGVGTIS